MNRPVATLREASQTDVDAITQVFLACWRISYADILPPAVIDAMTDERAADLWARALGAGEAQIFVAERATSVVGLVSFRPPLGADRLGYVPSLYVAPEAHGLGIGHQLLDRACAALRAAGATSAYLWVFAANQAALGFYQREGWLLGGQTRVEAEYGEPELRLWKALS